MPWNLSQYYPFSNFVKIKNKEIQDALLPQGRFPPSSFVEGVLEKNGFSCNFFTSSHLKKIQKKTKLGKKKRFEVRLP